MERFHLIKRVCARQGVKIDWPDKSEKEMRKLEKEAVRKARLREWVREEIRRDGKELSD